MRRLRTRYYVLPLVIMAAALLGAAPPLADAIAPAGEISSPSRSHSA